ncbi:MAG: DUF883 family protein [Candidatus Moranbacteria bacterium]|nr:DUF883 family protein [Candidatus Moranbacteria bacterium]
MAKNTLANGVSEVKVKVEKELDKSRAAVEREAAKMKKSVDTAIRKAEDFMKKNPEKAAAIAAGVGAALGAAAALLLSVGKKKGKK